MEEEGVELVASDEASEGFEPTDRTFDDPAFAIPPQRSSVLRGRSFAAATMRTDEFDAALGRIRCRNDILAVRDSVRGLILSSPLLGSGDAFIIRTRSVLA
jgi:hypothetical protein